MATTKFDRGVGSGSLQALMTYYMAKIEDTYDIKIFGGELQLFDIKDKEFKTLHLEAEFVLKEEETKND